MNTNHAVFPWETNTTEQNAKYTSQDIHEKRIHPECLEEKAPFFLSLDIDNPDKQSQETGCQATSSQHESRRPNLFIDRTSVTQQETSKSQDSTHQEQGDDL